jgi:hypothetical protein|tara:strand:+ start:19420 stop:19614 length:195 start_codon:yes stop_codon:yes gene_type:complete
MEHRIVNGLHVVETRTLIENTIHVKINVYTEQEYRDLEIQSSWWSRVKETLTSLGAGASWALKH